jgi:asparagine synthase (glutamine-hydrolysing)
MNAHIEKTWASGTVGSIVDLSPTGAQPMSNPDRSSWIPYNGEFYNHREFRKRLEAKGCV